MKKSRFLLLLWAVLFFCFSQVGSSEPLAVYLSWRQDPTTTMVVNWVEEGKERDWVFHYRALEEEATFSIPVESVLMRRGTAYVQHVELTHLHSDQEYIFWLEEKRVEQDSWLSKNYRFRTLPQDLNKPVRFAIGGDVYFHYELFRKMNAAVAKQDPAFVILGGDIAYAYGHRPLFAGENWDWERWRTFLQVWNEQMVDSEGRLIPVIPVVGNHDVKGNIHQYQEGNAKRSLFYDLFVFNEDMGSYRVVDIGNYLRLFLLDSGHTHLVDGSQKIWLEEQIGQHRDITYKMAAYHIPGYPARGTYNNQTPTKIRTLWGPLFEKGDVQVVFEHHNHVYKQSVLIAEGKEASKGVRYLGDGSWGTPVRHPRSPDEVWYLDKSAAVNAVFIVDLTRAQCNIHAMDNDGHFFDEVPPVVPLKDR